MSTMYQPYGSSNNQMFSNNFGNNMNNNMNNMNNNMNLNNNNRFGNSMGLSQNMLNLSHTSKINNNQKNLMNYEVDVEIDKATRDLVYLGSNKDKFDNYMKKLNQSILGDDDLEKNQEEKKKYLQQKNFQGGLSSISGHGK